MVCKVEQQMPYNTMQIVDFPLSVYCKIAIGMCFVPMTTSLCNALYVIDRILQWYCVM